MLERHKEKKAEKEREAAAAEEARQQAQAAQAKQAALDVWSHQMEELQRLLALASGDGPSFAAGFDVQERRGRYCSDHQRESG